MAYGMKGLALMKFGRYDEAVECFDKALEIDPSLAYVWMNRGNALDDWGEHKEAIKSYRNALEIETDPYSIAEIWNNIGLCFLNMKDFPQASESYDKALEIERAVASLRTNASDDVIGFVKSHTFFS